MKFSDMVELLRTGTVAQRSDWVGQWVGLCQDWDDGCPENYKKPFLYIRTSNAIVEPWSPKIEDLVAVDWHTGVTSLKNSSDLEEQEYMNISILIAQNLNFVIEFDFYKKHRQKCLELFRCLQESNTLRKIIQSEVYEFIKAFKEPPGENQFLRILEKASEKGVPIPLKMWMAASHINPEELERELKEKIFQSNKNSGECDEL